MLGLRQGVEQVMVVWEFGRVGVWDIATGHTAEELGDVKLGSGKLGGGWAIRREEGKAEGNVFRWLLHDDTNHTICMQC